MKIAILTPIVLEFEEIITHLLSPQAINGHPYPIVKGNFQGKNHHYEIILVQSGPRNANTSIVTTNIIKDFNPSAIFLIGIAGGVKDLKIGDILIGEKIYNYESGKETTEGFKARPEVYYCSKTLISSAKLVASEKAWLKQTKFKTLQNIQVLTGAIASGDKVVNTIESHIYERIKDKFNDTLALEMEGYGFAEAASFHSHIPILIIRGISDLLDDKSKTDGEGMQEIAINNAANFAFEFLNQLELHASKNLNMNIPDFTKEMAMLLLPYLENPNAQKVNPYVGQLLQKVQELIPKPHNRWIGDPQNTDYLSNWTLNLQDEIEDNLQIQKDLLALLEKIKEEPKKPEEHSKIVVKKSKNVIAGSTINVGGNFHQGDVKNVIKKQNNNNGNGSQINIDTNHGDIKM